MQEASRTEPYRGAFDEDQLSQLADLAQEDEGRTEAVLFNEDQTDAGQPMDMVSMSDFEIMTVLGLGSFGRVMKVKRKRTGEILP